jgi:16S rRNA G966 N2-methylase RsmD
MNRLYFGDNLGWLRDRREFPDASVDLVYLDPPFNSNADYNVLFREASGQVSQAQFHKSRYSKILLAKIFLLRYTTSTLLVRYVDVRVALTRL